MEEAERRAPPLYPALPPTSLAQLRRAQAGCHLSSTWSLSSSDTYNQPFAEEKPQGSSWSRSEGKAMEKQEADGGKPWAAARGALGRGSPFPRQRHSLGPREKMLELKNLSMVRPLHRIFDERFERIFVGIKGTQ